MVSEIEKCGYYPPPHPHPQKVLCIFSLEQRRLIRNITEVYKIMRDTDRIPFPR